MQNLDVEVSGTVTDQGGSPVKNVRIIIQRGVSGHFVGTVYDNYDTINTDYKGEYKYLVKDDQYNYNICCEAPLGYSNSGQSCVQVDQSITNSRTIPNIINFTLSRH